MPTALGVSPFWLAWGSKSSSATRLVMDSQLYFLLPRWTPRAAASVAVYSFFLLVGWLGWLAGILAWLASYALVLEKLMQITLKLKTSRCVQGAAWGMIFSITMSYVNYVSRGEAGS